MDEVLSSLKVEPLNEKKAVMLTPQATRDLARRDFNLDIGVKFISEQLDKFVETHVRIVQVGNTHITIIDQEHDNYKGEIDPIVESYLRTERTRSFVPEYFAPELNRNIPDLPARLVPLMDKAFGIKTKDVFQTIGRGVMFTDLANSCKDKRVDCVDIANNGLYETYFTAMLMAPGLLALLPGIDLNSFVRLIGVFLLPAFYMPLRLGVLDNEKIH